MFAVAVLVEEVLCWLSSLRCGGGPARGCGGLVAAGGGSGGGLWHGAGRSGSGVELHRSVAWAEAANKLSFWKRGWHIHFRSGGMHAYVIMN